MRISLWGMSALAFACALSASPVTIHGYVTGVTSPTEFSVGAYNVTREEPGQELHPGWEVEVQGEYNEASRSLRSTSVKFIPADNINGTRTVIADRTVKLNGELAIDGELLAITPDTSIVFRDGQNRDIPPGAVVNYEGSRGPDGRIFASKIEVTASPANKAARFTASKIKDGEIDTGGYGRYKMLADAEAQAYAQRIGESLIPAWQQELPANSEKKIPFQFYLVQDHEFFAVSLPNGTVIVSTEVLRVSANEAQFAAVLAHEIAHILQQHTSRTTALENQASRLSLGYLAAAGYDPRAAITLWGLIETLHPAQQNASFWGTPTNALLQQTYLTTAIQRNFSSLNFISYSLGGNDFARLAVRLGDRMDEPREVESRPSETSAARPGLNTVTILSTPPGSEVVIGGRLAGKTPLTLMTGKTGLPFSVTVRRAGYFDWNIQSTSVPGNSTLRAELMPAR